MRWFKLTRRRLTAASAMLFAAFVVLHGGALSSEAGILLPEQVGFDATDLDLDLNNGAGAASSTSSSDNSHTWPPRENDKQSDPLGLNSPLPMSSSSSSSSSSSAGGASGSGVVLCVFNSTVAIADDAPLGRLAEDHGLSLPDPPGTDLLRPPRR